MQLGTRRFFASNLTLDNENAFIYIWISKTVPFRRYFYEVTDNRLISLTHRLYSSPLFRCLKTVRIALETKQKFRSGKTLPHQQDNIPDRH